MVKDDVLKHLLSKNSYIEDVPEIYHKFGDCDDALRELLNENKIVFISGRAKGVYYVKVAEAYLSKRKI